MFTILFTTIGRRVELVQAFHSSYKRHGIQARILGVDADPHLAPAGYFADKIFKVPLIKEAGYVDTLLEICQRERVNLLIPLFEPEFLLLDERRQEFAAKGTFVLLSDRKVIETCKDKLLTYQFFQANGVRMPLSWLPGGEPDEPEYPLFVKPRSGMGSAGIQKIDNNQQLTNYLACSGDILVQQFIPGTEYTLDVLADLTGTVLSVVPRQRIEVRSGEVSKSRTVNRGDLIEQCRHIVEQLGAIGPVTVQCIDTGSEVYWIEINPRLGGGVPLAIEAGVDYPLLLAKMLAGEKVQPQLGRFRENLTMLRYDQAVYLEMPGENL